MVDPAAGRRARPSLGERVECLRRAFARLLEAALGPLADDPVAMAITATAVGPPLHYALRAAGLSTAGAVEAQLGVILPWLALRLGATDSPSRDAQGS